MAPQLTLFLLIFVLKLTKRHKATTQADSKLENKSDSSREKDRETTKESKTESKDTKTEMIPSVSEGPTKAKNIKRKAKLIKTPIIGKSKLIKLL